MRALDVSTCYIGIEDNKPAAIDIFSEKVKDYTGIQIIPLKKKYPQGGEKQLIDAIIGKRVPSKGLPIDVGAVVQNCATAYAVYEAVQKNKPLFEGIVTVTGRGLKEMKNILVRVGTPIDSILESAGGLPEGDVKVISGGPMMGKAISCLEAAIVKSSSSILVLSGAETRRQEESNCIRCGKCIEACPMGLEPYLLNKLARVRNMEQLEAEKIYDCIECGSCMFTCPANIPLLDYIRIAKADVMRIMRSRPKK